MSLQAGLRDTGIRLAHVALQAPNFCEFCEMVRVAGETIDRFAHRLEGSEPHRHIWMARGSHAAKRQRLLRETGFVQDVHKGRQAAWLQMEGFDLLVSELRNGTSDLLQASLQAMEQDAKIMLVRMQTDLAEALVEELTDKLSFHWQCPYSLIGLYWCVLKPEAREQCKRGQGITSPNTTGCSQTAWGRRSIGSRTMCMGATPSREGNSDFSQTPLAPTSMSTLALSLQLRVTR